MIKCWPVIFVLLMTLFQGAHAADNISGNFDIIRTETKTTEREKDTSRSLNQRYNLDLRKDLTSRIYFTTNVGMNMTETFGMNATTTDDTDVKETTQLYPQFRLNIANNYFNANAGYMLNEEGLDMFGIHPDQARRTTETWNSYFSTNSVKYPDLRFCYSQDRVYDHLSVHAEDSFSRYYDLHSDYTYKFVTLTLRHNKNKEDDYVNNTEDTTTVNEGRINFRESFWSNRITTSGIYTVTDTDNENVTSTGTSTPDEIRKRLIFDAGLRLRPFKWSRISYDYELNDTDIDSDQSPEQDPDPGTSPDPNSDSGTNPDSEPDTDIDRTLQAHTICIRGDARLHRYLKSWAQYLKRLDYNSAGDDTSTDTFTLNFDSTPVETLNANLMFNHVINKTESETQSKTSSMLLHIIANIWEGVDLSVDGNISFTDNIAKDTDTDTLVKTIDSDLRLKLTRTLTTEINYITNWIDSDKADGTETSTFNYTIRTDLYYRPVQSFYFKFSHALHQNENAEDSSYYIADINWLMTEKLRLNLQYRVDKNSGDDTNFSADPDPADPATDAAAAAADYTNFSADLVWNMSKIFVLRFKYDWRREKNDTLTKTNTFTTILSADF